MRGCRWYRVTHRWVSAGMPRSERGVWHTPLKCVRCGVRAVRVDEKVVLDATE